MGVCILKKCEYAPESQCCMVCPKGLDKVNERAEVRKKIEACVAMLKRVRNKTRRLREDGLPVGVCFTNGVYVAHVCYEGNQIYLGGYANLEDAEDVREKAEEAKRNGYFPRWLRKFRAAKKNAQKGKRTAKNGVLSNDQGT